MIKFNTKTFNILKATIEIFSDEVENNIINTIAIINGTTHYLGEADPNIISAILAYQEFNKCKITDPELNQILIDNHCR